MQSQRSPNSLIVITCHGLAVAACALAVLAFGACHQIDGPQGERPHARNIAADTAGPASAPSDTLEGGCSGGVTGGGNGVAVTGRGEILEWTRRTATQPVEFTAVRTDSVATAAVFAEAQRIRFRSINHNEPFNVTCSLTLTDSAGSHTVAWPVGEAPRVVLELNHRLHALIAQ